MKMQDNTNHSLSCIIFEDFKVLPQLPVGSVLSVPQPARAGGTLQHMQPSCQYMYIT